MAHFFLVDGKNRNLGLFHRLFTADGLQAPYGLGSELAELPC